jgi:hypothetical protein
MWLNEFESRRWKSDVETFSSLSRLYGYTNPDHTTLRERISQRLQELQERWPHHKLGDMPSDIAA